jgi:hypothetical protein
MALQTLPITRAALNSDGIKLSDQIYLASDNPDQTAQTYQANKNVFWMSFIDYSMNHPEILSGYMTEYIQNEKAPIFSMFPIKLTNQGRIYQNRIVIDPVMPEIGTRKVPHRQISVRVERREGSTVYTGEAFAMDYHYLRTPEGMQYFDKMANAVVSDIWRMVAFSTIKEFQSNATPYSNPDQLYPYDEAPNTPDDCFKYEALQYGALNKNPQAIHNLCARVGRIFEANNGSPLARMILTADASNFINVRDQTNLYYDKSGPQILANRGAGNVIRQIHGLEVIPIELMANELHSNAQDLVLQNEVVTGGMFKFPEKCQSLPPHKYRSHFRNIKASSWSSNKMEEYSFQEAIHHCPEFYPLSHPDQALRGTLNTKVIESVFKENSIVFSKTRVKLNEHIKDQLHQFLTRRGSNINKFSFVRSFGEIEECHLHTRYLTFVYKTMEYALTKDLTDSEKREVENSTSSARVKFMSALARVYKIGEDITSGSFVKDNIINSSLNLPPNDYPQVFIDRYNATKSMSFFEGIAARAVLTQPITLQNIDAWFEHNIAIPFGFIGMRPFESQFMESIIFTASGNVGNLYFSGIDNIVSFDPGSQHFNTQIFGHFKPFISDPSKFYVAANTRGLQILGGKGNKYINASETGREINDPEHDTWKGIMTESFGSGEKLGDYSIIPILTGYNYAIEDQFKDRHYDVRGYWDSNDFVSRLDARTCQEFVTERELPMYPNQFLTNTLYPFDKLALNPLPNNRASFDQLQNRRRANTHVHQITQDVYNPLTGNWEEIVSSAPWGRERDGIVQIQNSTAGVSL